MVANAPWLAIYFFTKQFYKTVWSLCATSNGPLLLTSDGGIDVGKTAISNIARSIEFQCRWRSLRLRGGGR